MAFTNCYYKEKLRNLCSIKFNAYLGLPQKMYFHNTSHIIVLLTTCYEETPNVVTCQHQPVTTLGHHNEHNLV